SHSYNRSRRPPLQVHHIASPDTPGCLRSGRVQVPPRTATRQEPSKRYVRSSLLLLSASSEARLDPSSSASCSSMNSRCSVGGSVAQAPSVGSKPKALWGEGPTPSVAFI